MVDHICDYADFTTVKMLLLQQQRRSRSTIGGLIALNQLYRTVALDYSNFFTDPGDRIELFLVI